MSGRRTRLNSIAPIDNLTSNSHTSKNATKRRGLTKLASFPHNSSKRYQEFRNASKITNITSKDFIPNLESNRTNGSCTEISKISTSHPDSVKQRVELSGFIELIENNTNEILSDPFSKGCVMVFANDQNGPRCSFRHKQLPIPDLQLFLKEDCDEVATEDTNVNIAFRFSKPRTISISKNNQIIIKGMIFITSPLYKQKIIKIRRMIASLPSKFKIKRLSMFSTKSELKFRLISDDYVKSVLNKSSFLDKGFKSLEKNTSSKKRNIDSMVNSATKIKILKHAPESPKTATTSDVRELKPKPGLDKDNITRLTRSNTKAITLGHVENTTDDELISFNPSLSYQFKDGVSYTINNQDFKSLYNNDWVNDTIIDFFIKFFLETNISKTEFNDKIYIMSSFFYTKLISKGVENVYVNVKKWVEHADLFSKSYIIIPINSNYHWFGCIITNLIEYMDYINCSSTDGTSRINEKEPSIIEIWTLDSLKQPHNKDIEVIKQFIIAYAEDKYSIIIDKNNIKKKTCIVPRQPNMNDCGVHLIENFKVFSEKPEETREFWNRVKTDNNYNLKLANDFFNKKDRISSRQRFRDILLDLQQDQVKNRPANKDHLDQLNNVDDDNDDDEIEIIENIEEYKKHA